MKKIMIFIGSYLPGTKTAGVTTSISNMVKELHDEFEFYIVTADRDIGEEKPYSNVVLEQWTKYGDANVFYSGKYIKSISVLKSIINSVDVDIYYFNGFYNTRDTARVLFLWKTSQIKRKPFIMAPRGIFNMGEFKTHELMRKIYRASYKLFGLDKKTYWHATADVEKQKISEYFPNAKDRIFVVGNLSGIELKPIEKHLEKKPGSLKIMFISRISEKKNIKFIVETLMHIKAEKIDCDIYGMIGTEADQKYWHECEEAAGQLPKYINFQYIGEVPHEDVSAIFREHHLFFFPTFGENYGHVIAESIANGCPVLMSDTTPWNNLPEYHAGWIYSLNQKEAFIRKLQELVDMPVDEWKKYSDGAYDAAKQLVDNNALRLAHLEMFNNMIQGGLT